MLLLRSGALILLRGFLRNRNSFIILPFPHFWTYFLSKGKMWLARGNEALPTLYLRSIKHTVVSQSCPSWSAAHLQSSCPFRRTQSRRMSCGAAPHLPGVRLPSAISALAAAATVNQLIRSVKAHSEVQICVFTLGSGRAPPPLPVISFVWFMIQIRSHLPRRPRSSLHADFCARSSVTPILFVFSRVWIFWSLLKGASVEAFCSVRSCV